MEVAIRRSTGHICAGQFDVRWVLHPECKQSLTMWVHRRMRCALGWAGLGWAGLGWAAAGGDAHSSR